MRLLNNLKAKVMAKSKSNVRSAKTGRFVSSAKAKNSPSTTVSEKRTPRSKKQVVCENCVAKPGLMPGSDHELCPTCNGTGKVQA
jgi:DnaJ-class molecular chaperone